MADIISIAPTQIQGPSLPVAEVSLDILKQNNHAAIAKSWEQGDLHLLEGLIAERKALFTSPENAVDPAWQVYTGDKGHRGVYLIDAARYQFPGVMDLFLKAGADPNLTDKNPSNGNEHHRDHWVFTALSVVLHRAAGRDADYYKVLGAVDLPVSFYMVDRLLAAGANPKLGSPEAVGLMRAIADREFMNANGEALSDFQRNAALGLLGRMRGEPEPAGGVAPSPMLQKPGF